MATEACTQTHFLSMQRQAHSICRWRDWGKPQHSYFGRALRAVGCRQLSQVGVQGLDPESLERDNNQGIDLIGDKVSELRKVRAQLLATGSKLAARRSSPLACVQLTYGIKSEVDSQNSTLDNMVGHCCYLCDHSQGGLQLLTRGSAPGRPDGARPDQPGRCSHALQAGAQAARMLAGC